MNLDVRIHNLARSRGLRLSQLTKKQIQALAIEAMDLREKAVGAVKRVIAEATLPVSRVSEEEYERRKAICDGCSSYLKDRGCLACGCFDGFETKLNSSVFSCPKRRW